MLNLHFPKQNDRNYKLLCLGAHADDIEIGCGGTILRFLSEYPNTEVCWVVFAGNGERATEADRSANLFLAEAKKRKVVINNFRDSFFPYIGAEIKEFFEVLKSDFSPDLILTHYRKDFHQDHRLISELTWNTFRDHLILEYEIVKYDGDLGSPNFFVHLDENICNRKLDHIIKSFVSQNNRKWFSEEIFLSILRIRGVEANAPHNYAEGFYCHKIIF